MRPKEMIQEGLNGNILEHMRNQQIMMIDLNGVMQLTKRKNAIKNMKLMPKTIWELYNLINAENAERCEPLEHIIVVPARDASIEWTIIVLGQIIVSDI